MWWWVKSGVEEGSTRECAMRGIDIKAPATPPKTSSFIAEDGNALTRTLVTAAMLAPAECAVAELAFVFWGVRVSKTLRS
jgi:hypothetical protein